MPDRNVGRTGTTDPREWSADNVDYELVDYLERSIELCKQKGSVPVLVTYPPSFAYMPRYVNYEGYCDFVEELALKNEVDHFNFALLRRDVFSRDEAYYTEPYHMNGSGAEVFDRIFSEVMRKHWEGTLNRSDYFYGSFDELMLDVDYILRTWLTGDEDGVRASAFQGSSVQPEFEFLYKIEGEEAFTVFREYGRDPFVPELDLGGRSFVLRVNARAEGRDVDFEQYYEVVVEVAGDGGGFVEEQEPEDFDELEG